MPGIDVVWPPKVKDGPLPLVVFESQRWDAKKGVIVHTIHVTQSELVLGLVKKAVRGGLVILRASDGSTVGFDRDEDGEKFAYPNHGTKLQDRVPIERFPWEE